MDAEKAVRYVIENLLRPIGVDLSPKVFYDAALSSEDALNEMKQAVYIFLANLIIANKQDARSWIKKCNAYVASDVLRLLGFDPFLFDLDNNSQHLLITLLWLIWRADLFKTLYDPLLPSDEAYLPPYGTLCADDTSPAPKPMKDPPSDHDELTTRIQRLIGKISYQLQTLSDLEMTRETLHWEIRGIDPDSSLYALSLKSRPAVLAAHTKALKQAVENSDKLKNIEQIERTFWKWAFSVVDNMNLSSDRFEETRSIPIDWYPPITCAPFTRHNNAVDEMRELLDQTKAKLEQCKEKVGSGKINEKQSGLNGRQISLIKKEIDDYMESLERIEEVKVEEKEDIKTKLIPELPFKEFSDSKLQRIISKSENKCADIANRSCPEIAKIVKEICEENGYSMHGWKCNVQAVHRGEEEDIYERPPPRESKQKSIAAVARHQAALNARKAQLAKKDEEMNQALSRAHPTKPTPSKAQPKPTPSRVQPNPTPSRVQATKPTQAKDKPTSNPTNSRAQREAPPQRRNPSPSKQSKLPVKGRR